ncbi:hypothetical protein LTR62_002100 [Meristemomyces frigidus]|uniref:Uncharacterized protein n=1 Tax=Meristemomyces frigidus TaxID=1508187 RepID=A0AAN7TH41_9PEZI|nr:hypothetical protein LTR62_002100 [Meristemomyces frigidus]
MDLNLQPSNLYAFATSGYLVLQALPLLFTPSLIVSLLASGTRDVTDLETYLCRSSALTLLAFAVLTLLLTDSIPSANSWDTRPTVTFAEGSKSGSSDEKTSGKDRERDRDVAVEAKSPYASATAITTTVYHALQSFYLYTQIATTRSNPRAKTFGFYAGLTLTTTLFCFGLWVVLFAGTKSHRSKRTGADKRTGNWPFGNKESAKEIKKAVKVGEKEKEKERSGRSEKGEKGEKSDKEEKSEREKKEKRRSVARGSSWR